MKLNSNIIAFGIVVGTLLLSVPFLGMSHLFDWDEVNFAEAAREMLVTGEYSFVQINFKPFWEKPPLFIWMQAMSMKAFGVNEFAARFPNAICGALTLLLLFRTGTRLHSQKFGMLWALVFAGSILPQFYFRSGIIDPWFNLFIFLGILQLVEATRQRTLPKSNLLYSAFFIGLAVLTKGPTALGVVGLTATIYLISNFGKHQWKIADPIIFLSAVLFIGFSWFFLEILRGRGHIVYEFIDYHVRLFSQGEAGHAQPFYYHAVVLLFGCFPMSLFFIFRWFNKTPEPEQIEHFAKWMSILFWVVFIAFSIVKTKIIHYSSLTYFPMSFLAALSIQQLIDGQWKFKTVHQILLLLFVVLLGSVFTMAGIMDELREPLLSLLEPETLAYGNFAQQIHDGPFDPFIGILFMVLAMASVMLITAGKRIPGIFGLFGTTLLTVVALSVFIGPKIDRYTQASLFDFYEKGSGSAHYQPLGYHSYAHLFYGKRVPVATTEEDEVKWMMYEQVDKPVYFISRLHDLNANKKYFPHLQEIDRKGGYVILERTDENYPFAGER